MDWDRSKILTKWFSDLAISYNEFRKESKNCRCKIINIETNKKTNSVILFVLINGIKKQVQQSNKKNENIPTCRINRQEFSKGKTVFIINKFQEDGEERWSAHELYCDSALLTKFGHDDLKIIISTAIQEQAIEDFQDNNEE